MLDTRQVSSGIVKIIKSDKSMRGGRRGGGGRGGGECETRRQLGKEHTMSRWGRFNGMRGQKSKRWRGGGG